MSHAAKQRALEAYECGLLSARARLRLERHLAQCDLCRAARAQVQAYQALRAEAAAPPVDLALPSWERLEALLDDASSAPRAGRRPLPLGKVIALAWPTLAVAATLLIARLGSTPGDPGDAAPQARGAPNQHEARPSMPARHAWVSLVSGEARVEQLASSTLVDLASELREGDLLSTGEQAHLHVQVEGETGFALAPASRVRITRLRRGDTQLELYAGRITSQVKKLAASEAYGVHVAELNVSVRGTHFWVESGAQPAVYVHEGRVAIERAGVLLADLAEGQGYPRERFSHDDASATPVHLAPALEHSAGLLLPAHAGVRALVIDGRSISSAGSLAVRLPRGPTQLKLEDLRGQIRSVHVDLDAPLVRLSPAALDELLAPKPLPEGRLSAEQIGKVVRGAVEPLRRCYERNLRIAPKLEGKLTVRMRVSAEGRVVRSEFASLARLPLDLERCMEMELQKLVFPKPEGGGPLSFEVPLNLRSSR